MNALLKLFFISLLMTPFSLSGANDYQEHAKEVREIIWDWDKPEFKNYEMPEKYKKESAVIIARHKEIYVTNKNKFKLANALLMYGVSRVNRLYYTEIERCMVKINDKKALEEFSEFSFKEVHKFNRYSFSNKVVVIVGARVIKPDGKMIEIDIKEDAVSVTEGKKDKEAYKKVAISYLQEGDILDYFFSTEIELEDTNIPPFSFDFFGQYPILSFSAFCELSKSLTVEYRSINGAPDMIQKQDSDGDIILEVKKQDLPKIEFTRWMSPLRDLPMIRMTILNNANNHIFKPASARKSGTYKNVSSSDILNDAKCTFANCMQYITYYKPVINAVKKNVEHYKQKVTTVNDEELATYIYDATYFNFVSLYGFKNLSPGIFFTLLQNLFKTYNIEHQIGFVTSKYGARDNEVFCSGDYNYIMTANGEAQTFCFPFAYASYDYLDCNYQGETAHTITIEKMVPGKPQGIIGTSKKFTIPLTDPSHNKNSIVSEVSFSEENFLLLHINRRTSWSGDFKYERQRYFVLYEDWNNIMRNRLMMDKTLIQEIEGKEKDKRSVENFKKQLEENREKIKDRIEEDINGYYGKGPLKLIDYKIESPGITHESPELIYSSEYTMDGFVKKAEDNLILQVGKLIGIQWNPIDDDRNRLVDAYISTAISIENEIRITIPKGYEPQEIEKLNHKIENEYGLFESFSKIEDNQKLVINIRKIYKKAFVPAIKWDLMLNIFDRANEFSEQSIILKRQTEAFN